jgi:hypothetical protein
MEFVDNLQNQFCPISDNKKGSISVIKHWNIEQAAILVHEFVKANPFV